MGRCHALGGLIVGALTAGLLDHAPLPVGVLMVPVAGGAALLPDIDNWSRTGEGGNGRRAGHEPAGDTAP
jgi:hypothetical protein